MSIIAAALICIAPVAIDGDTVRCEGVRKPLRISGIDSPEMPGHCRRGRVCAPGDPHKAKAAMAALIKGKVTYDVIKVDLYGREIVVMYADGVNVSCSQIASGNAIFKPTWDAGKRIKAECKL